jgi:hypothetical protein
MHDDPMTDLALDLGDVDDNVIAMPDLLHGRLADLIQAAAGPPQEHELRGELAARTAFRSAVQSWPSPRRQRMRRGPAVVAATTMATMLVATTGLAAASVLPGSAGRAVDGLLGSVGVDIAPPSTPAAPAAPEAGDTAVVSAPALHRTGSVHVGCTAGGASPSGAAAGTVGSSSCALKGPLPPGGHVRAVSGPSVSHRSAPAVTKSAPVTHHGGSGSHAGANTPATTVPSTPPTTLPGGGTSRGGNQGVGGGGCKGGSTGSTTTTTTTDPTTTTTTDPSSTGNGCGHGGHHHGTSGGTTSTSTGGTGTTTS